MTITRDKLRVLREEMNAAFEKAGIKNFELEVDTMRYTSEEVTIKVKGKLKGVTTSTDRLFEQKVAEYGLKLVGEKGKRLTGYNPNRPKYPFSFETVRGTKYKATIEQAKQIFG